MRLFGLAVGACRWHKREFGSRGRTRVDAEQPRDLVHSLPVFGEEFHASKARLHIGVPAFATHWVHEIKHDGYRSASA
jgi:hypothetical protein